MSTCPAAFEVRTKPPACEAEETPCAEPEESAGSTGGRVRRWVRRFFRTAGILVVVGMAGFLTCQHLLWPILPESVALAAGPASPPAEDDRKVVVCFGYADLEGGITSLSP